MQSKDHMSNHALKNTAKIIQYKCRYNLSVTYRKAYKVIDGSDISASNKIILFRGIDSLLSRKNIKDNNKEKNIVKKYGLDGYYILHATRASSPTQKHIIAEINITKNRFNKVCIDNERISAEMGPFELEGVQFGRFRVSFKFSSFGNLYGEVRPYIKALEPNYPEGSLENSHPHVSLDSLCLGDGEYPLRAALVEARISDCFEIVKSVLNTYGEDPFIKIEAWTGGLCKDCGSYYDLDNDSNYCSRCDRVFCYSCITRCCSAAGNLCYDCKSKNFECQYCASLLCSECVDVCQKCNRRFL